MLFLISLKYTILSLTYRMDRWWQWYTKNAKSESETIGRMFRLCLLKPNWPDQYCKSNNNLQSGFSRHHSRNILPIASLSLFMSLYPHHCHQLAFLCNFINSWFPYSICKCNRRYLISCCKKYEGKQLLVKTIKNYSTN